MKRPPSRIVRSIGHFDNEMEYFVPLRRRTITTHDKRIYDTWDYIPPLNKDQRPKQYKTLRDSISAVEFYSDLQSKKDQDILVDAKNRELDKIVPRQSIPTTDGPAPAKKGTTRDTLFGYPVTSVIRWMGKDCWGWDEAKTALSMLKVRVADATIHAQLRAGKKGERGPPAPLNSSEEKKLYDCIN